MPSGRLSTWQKAGGGNSTSLAPSSHSRKVFHNSPTSGRRNSCRFEWVADDFNGRQGWNALLLTKKAFPIFAVSGSDDGQLDAAFNDARADGAAGESGGVVNVELAHDLLAMFFDGLDANAQCRNRRASRKATRINWASDIHSFENLATVRHFVERIIPQTMPVRIVSRRRAANRPAARRGR